jgi:hypothetical protein
MLRKVRPLFEGLPELATLVLWGLGYVTARKQDHSWLLHRAMSASIMALSVIARPTAGNEAGPELCPRLSFTDGGEHAVDTAKMITVRD